MNRHNHQLHQITEERNADLESINSEFPNPSLPQIYGQAPRYLDGLHAPTLSVNTGRNFSSVNNLPPRYHSTDYFWADLGKVKEYLGIKINYDRTCGVLVIDQATYARKVIEQFGLLNCKPVATPLPAGYSPVKNDSQCSSKDRSFYQQIIGSLLYLLQSFLEAHFVYLYLVRSLDTQRHADAHRPHSATKPTLKPRSARAPS